MSKKFDDRNDKATPSENEPDTSRRSLLKHGAIAAGGMAMFAAGYGETVGKAAKGLVTGSSGEVPPHALRGKSLTPEFRIDPVTGELSTQPGQIVAPSSCLGCWTQCGVRVRVDTQNNRILRVAGNPYHPLATTQPAPMQMPVREVFAKLGGESGLEGRATACARGSAMQEQHSSPYRVLKPLKRVGPRGSGKWETISFEQLIEEICEGGDLFGDGHVDGLRAIRDNETLIDPDNPEYGPRANQLLITDAANEGRTPLLRRFAGPGFGTVNVSNHGSYCGQSFRVGAGAALGDIAGMPHGKPDWTHAKFGLFLGTAPAQSGNPFQRQGRELAEARTRGEDSLRYVVVSPILPMSSSFTAGSGNRWVPVKPGTDLALALGLIRWILDNERYDTNFLGAPGPAAMAVVNEAAWTNATHLIVSDPEHPRFGTCLRGSDMGWKPTGDTQDDVYVVRLPDDSLAPHTVAQPAQIMVDDAISVPGLGPEPVAVRSALAMLHHSVSEKSLADYSELCGVPVADIEAMASEFTSYGKQAAADAHGGTMNGSGFYTAYAISMLNTLIGNLNVRGGLVLDAGPFGPFGKGPRYDFTAIKNPAKPRGLALSRHGLRYEKSTEFKRKQARGEQPYPARAPWYPAPGALSSEMLASGMAGYPYPIKAWINHISNPVYAIAGFKNLALERLHDPAVVPLIVSINPFINETSAESDYIVPDTVTYESWGIGAPWADVVAKSSTVRTPAVAPAVAKTATGEPINFESFLIACALRLELPGFGKDAIGDPQGGRHDLLTAEDFYLRGVANIAFAGGKAVASASDDDLVLTGIDRYTDSLKDRLRPEEWRQVAMVLSRGGRFQNLEQAWDGDQIRQRHLPPLQLWSEELSKMRHSMTGERYSGCPAWYPTRLANGDAMREHFSETQWPFLLTSYKSNLMSSISIGASRLRQVHPHNPVSLNRHDAEQLGIRNGDRVRIVTPGGAITSVVLVRDGIARGAVAIEHGYGHTELGARSHVIDDRTMPSDKALAAGVNLNELGFADPTRPDVTNTWIDWVSGGVVRQGFPARLEKIVA
jgi:tetrathionate reductase subunit A